MKTNDFRYCWFPNRVYPRESQWSLVHKFATWNALNAHRLHQIIGNQKPTTPTNLARSCFIHVERFNNVTGLSRRRILEAFPDIYLSKNLRFDTVPPWLQYCPECIAIGYHSVLHQLDLLSYCPYHKIDLLYACPSCSSLITTEMTSLSIRHAYGCPRCGYCFCWKLRSLSYKGLTTEQRDTFLSVGRRVENLSRRSAQFLAVWGNENLSNKEAAEKGWDKFALWNEMLPGACNNVNNHNDIRHIEVKWSVNPSSSDSTKRILDTYRAIRRRITRKVLKSHRRCLLSARQLGCVTLGFCCDKPLGCEVVHAYLIWRMYWERRQSISCLLNDELPRFRFQHYYYLEAESAVRAFAIECLHSFYVYLKLAKQIEKRGEFELKPSDELREMLSQSINWVVLWQESQPQGNLHYWISQDLVCHEITDFKPSFSDHLVNIQEQARLILDELKRERYGQA